MKFSRDTLRSLLFVLLIGTAAATALRAASGSDCDCGPAGSLYDAIFAGKAVAVEAAGAQGTRVTFEVSQLWKGPSSKRLIVTIDPTVASCGQPFRAGEEYLVYATHPTQGWLPSQLHSSACAPSKPLAQAGNDLAKLGTGQQPALGNLVLLARPSPEPLLFVAALGMCVMAAIRNHWRPRQA